MKHIGFKFPFSFPAGGEDRYILKFKVKLPKEIEKISRCGVILSSTIDRVGVIGPFTSSVHMFLSIGNKKIPVSNLIVTDGSDIHKGISLIELNRFVYPAGQYVSGYFEVQRAAIDNAFAVVGTFTLVIKTN